MSLIAAAAHRSYQLGLTPVAQHGVEIALAIMGNDGGRRCPILSFVTFFSDREGVEDCAIGFNSAGAAPRGELLRVNFDFVDPNATRLHLANLFLSQLKPRLVGLGEIEVAGTHPSEGTVILPGESKGDN